MERKCPGCGQPITPDMCTIRAKAWDGEREYHVPCAGQGITVYGVEQDSCGSTIWHDRAEDAVEQIRGAIMDGMMVDGDDEVFTVKIKQMSRVKYDCLPEAEC